MRWLGFAINLIVAFSFNIDTIALTTHLYRDKEARDAAATLAERVTHATDEKLFDECLALDREKRAAAKQCQSLIGLADAVTSRNASLAQLPIGKPRDLSWPTTWERFGTFALAGLGWLLTALALSLGAPFWFDFLGRFVNVRHGIRKPKAEPKAATV